MTEGMDFEDFMLMARQAMRDYPDSTELMYSYVEKIIGQIYEEDNEAKAYKHSDQKKIEFYLYIGEYLVKQRYAVFGNLGNGRLVPVGDWYGNGM